MSYKPTYNKIYKTLKEIIEKNKGKINFTEKNTYYKYLKNNKYLEEKNVGRNYIIYTYSDKAIIFIDKYNSFIGKIEYFFKDYPFLGSTIIGFMGGLGATILNLIFK